MFITIALAEPEHAAHLRELATAVDSGRVDLHLVEHPGVAEIRHPREAGLLREGGCHPCADAYGDIERVDEIHTRGVGARQSR